MHDPRTARGIEPQAVGGMMPLGENASRQTPIDEISGLIPRGVTTRERLNVIEAENIRKAVLRYLSAPPTRRQAPFAGRLFSTVRTLSSLHDREMSDCRPLCTAIACAAYWHPHHCGAGFQPARIAEASRTPAPQWAHAIALPAIPIAAETDGRRFASRLKWELS